MVWRRTVQPGPWLASQLPGARGLQGAAVGRAAGARPLQAAAGQLLGSPCSLNGKFSFAQ